MKRYPQLCDIENCVNCKACLSACNHGALHFEQDDYGFLHPVVDENLCVQCNLCELSCPIINPPAKKCENPEVYALYSKDFKNVQSSSSGGVFFEAAKHTIQEGGYVFGVVNVDGRYEYRCAETLEEVLPMRGSKYVQADVKDSLVQVRKILRSGKKVLFTGTPCLIAGLRSFLRKDYAGQLVTLEMVCHGIPSQKVFDRCMELSGVSVQDRKQVSFRDTKGWGYLTQYAPTDKHEKKKILFWKNDLFMRLFNKTITFKPKCYDCPFSMVPRTADLTMGDFWGCKETPSFRINKSGTSVLLINSAEGKNMWENVQGSFIYEERLLEDAAKYNWNLKNKTPRPADREKLLSDLFTLDRKSLIKKYHLQITLRNIVGFVSRRIKSFFH